MSVVSAKPQASIDSLANKLFAGVELAGLNLSADKVQKLLDYLALMQKWNKIHNLTAVRDADEMVTVHLLDSLSVLPYINADNLLDVGSGGGLPGIPLAICLPQLQVTVIDSNQKKVSFMRQAKAELNISNLQVAAGRVEQYQPGYQFDLIISRAFSEISLFLKLTQHLLAPYGKWLAMKGVYPEEELASASVVPTEVVPLTVPGLDAKRHLAIIPFEQFVKPVVNYSGAA